MIRLTMYNLAFHSTTSDSESKYINIFSYLGFVKEIKATMKAIYIDTFISSSIFKHKTI